MPSLVKGPATRFATRKFAPWLLALDLAKGAHDHWEVQLSARQRKRLLTLLRKSGGRPSKLTRRQRKEVLDLLSTFDVPAFVKREIKTTAGLKPAKTPSRKAIQS